MKKNEERFFAATAPGLEGVCETELMALGMTGVQGVAGGVEFCGSLRELYLANLWLRTASRVLVRFGEMRCRDFPSLYRKALQLPWGRYVKPGTRLQVRSTCRRSRLQHTERIAETLKEAMVRALGGSGTDAPEGPEQLLVVTLEDDLCRLSLDSSGALLHRRGYRQDIGAAPLRETLAAGILLLLGWHGERPLLDPMCGSGTFLIEGALLALKKPPGAERSFAFMDWPRYRPGLWQALLLEAGKQHACCPPLTGYDRDAGVLEAARRNAERAGVADFISLRQMEAGRQAPMLSEPGLAICNPPYGTRLGRGELGTVYRSLGQLYSGIIPDWQRAFICPEASLAKDTGLSLARVGALQNGGIRVGLFLAK